MRKALLLSCIALIGASTYFTPVSSQVESGTAQIGGSSSSSGETSTLGKVSDLWITHGADFTDGMTADHSSSIFNTLGEAFKGDAKTTHDLFNKTLNLATNSKLSPELADAGKKVAAGLRDSEAKQLAAAGLSDKIADTLDFLDKYTLAVKTAAYLSEGDVTGAVNLWVKDTAKKLLEKVTTLGLGKAGKWLGLKETIGAGLLGTLTGEVISENVIDAWLDRNEQAVRDAEYREKYLNKPWLPAQQVMDDHGNVHTLDPDTYVERGTGLIKRRTPEEQARYEDQQHTKWLDGRTWEGIMNDLASGKINAAQYEEFRSKYSSRDPSKPWDPNAVSLLGAGRFAGSYSGRFAGGGSGSIHFTISGTNVSGTLSGVCTKNPCQGDAVAGSFRGSISDLGIIRTSLTGTLTSTSGFTGSFGFSGSLNGAADGRSAGGEWVGHNKYGDPAGTWSAGKQ